MGVANGDATQLISETPVMYVSDATSMKRVKSVKPCMDATQLFAADTPVLYVSDVIDSKAKRRATELNDTLLLDSTSRLQVDDAGRQRQTVSAADATQLFMDNDDTQVRSWQLLS